MKYRATLIKCENPECKTAPVEVSTQDPEPPQGYYIDKGAFHLDFGGGPLKDLYFCSVECIAPGLQEVIHRVMQG